MSELEEKLKERWEKLHNEIQEFINEKDEVNVLNM